MARRLPYGDVIVPKRIALTVNQAAEIIGCSRPTIYAAIKRGELRKFKIGRMTRIPVADVYALVGYDGDSIGGESK
jgi:excisionase family DNA binding protein